MTTNNTVNVGLSGQTGSGSFVGSTSPSLTTPTLGAATGTSLTFSPTTGGIVGTTTNDNAGAGKVGEYISSVIVSGSAVSMTTLTDKTITSISLTAGDWDVWGEVYISGNGVTEVYQIVGAISTVDNTIPTVPADGASFQNISSTAGNNWTIGGSGVPSLSLSPCRVSLNATTTIYLVASYAFLVSTLDGFGKICARRVR
ncbi:MAG: hypothetical protein WC753_04745 [Candidatus Gracilibacteria bacterium]|jgi:hypothetical protein